MLAPHSWPFGAMEPTSEHVSVVQFIAPLWQGAPGGVHMLFGTHAWQDPFSQYMFVPHGVPPMTLPFPVQVAPCAEQLNDIAMHDPSGVQSCPCEHVVHAPLTHTPPSHDTPFDTLVIGSHCSTPPSHCHWPFWHAEAMQGPIMLQVAGASAESGASLRVESGASVALSEGASPSIGTDESDDGEVSFGTVESAAESMVSACPSTGASILPPSVVASSPPSPSTRMPE
jgi:hypothetical protein